MGRVREERRKVTFWFWQSGESKTTLIAKLHHNTSQPTVAIMAGPNLELFKFGMWVNTKGATSMQDSQTGGQAAIGSIERQASRWRWKEPTWSSLKSNGPAMKLILDIWSPSSLSRYLFFPLAVMVHYGDPEWYHKNVLPVSGFSLHSFLPSSASHHHLSISSCSSDSRSILAKGRDLIRESLLPAISILSLLSVSSFFSSSIRIPLTAPT